MSEEQRKVYDPFGLFDDEGQPINPLIEGIPAVDIINGHLQQAFTIFQTLTSAGISVESARKMMPICTSQAVIMTDKELSQAMETGSAALSEYNIRVRELMEANKAPKPKKKYKKFTKDEIQEIEKAHLLGSKPDEIANLFGVTTRRIETILKKQKKK